MLFRSLGLKAEFKCEISKEGLKAEWRKGGKAIKKSDKYSMVDESTVHTLIIEDAQAEDEAEYTVWFRDDATSTAKLIIHAPPKFGDVSEELILNAGQSTAIEVPFTGNPQPKITWTFNGGKYTDSRRIKDETIFNMTSLTMAKVIRKDGGKYNVAMENPYGNANVTINVIVLDKPGPPQNLKITSVTESTDRKSVV